MVSPYGMVCAGATLVALLMVGASATAGGVGATPPPPPTLPPFSIQNNQFILNGTAPVRLLAGEFHYFRIPAAYWADRLARVASLGLNTLQIYVPWNFHERAPGHVTWSGRADLASFLDLAASAGFKILLRPGPYICAEWDGGGLPWWLRSPAVAGGAAGGGGWRPDGRLRPRSADPLFLGHVSRWFATHLLPLLAPYMVHAGGPILAVQVENEYGFCGDAPGDEPGAYLRALAGMLKAGLGNETVLYTTDPPSVIKAGTLAGPEVTSMVDFGPGTDVAWAFSTAAAFNPPGFSPAFVSEWYTGWLTHYGEGMARTDVGVMERGLGAVLGYKALAADAAAGGVGASLSLYMAAGGTNFGFWAGANIAGRAYLPHVTTYDYDCPIGEGGGEGQAGVPGDGGGGGGGPSPTALPSKAEVVRAALRVAHAADGTEPLAPMVAVPPPPARAHGEVSMDASAPLLSPSALALLSPGAGVASATPLPMESVGQGHGLILYRATVAAAAFACAANGKGPTLDTGGPVHDFATVLLGGWGPAADQPLVAGRLDRSSPVNLALPCLDAPSTSVAGATITLDILVEAVGRDNFGCGELDWKGLETGGVRLGGETIREGDREAATHTCTHPPTHTRDRHHTHTHTTAAGFLRHAHALSFPFFPFFIFHPPPPPLGTPSFLFLFSFTHFPKKPLNKPPNPPGLAGTRRAMSPSNRGSARSGARSGSDRRIAVSSYPASRQPAIASNPFSTLPRRACAQAMLYRAACFSPSETPAGLSLWREGEVR
jgi:beta-galactosidase